MSFPVSVELLQAITLSPRLVHKYGTMPYFRNAVNKCGKFYIKFKVSNSEYIWSRVIEIVETSTISTWNGKKFNIMFRVENISALVPCESLSSKPLETTDIHWYCLKRQEAAARKTNAVDSSTQPLVEPEAQELNYAHLLVTEAEINEAKKILSDEVTHRILTADDKVAIEESGSRLGASAGNIAAMHTVTALGNMQLETKLGLSTSTHCTGASARAHAKRPGDSTLSGTQDVMTQSFADFSQRSVTVFETQELSTQSLSMTQSQKEVDQSAAAAYASQWLEAKENEVKFTDYVTNPARSQYIEMVAKKTKENALKNTAARLKGAMAEKNLKRTGNLLQAQGLWITDDDLRNSTAIEADETIRSGTEKKKEEKKEAKVAAQPSRTDLEGEQKRKEAEFLNQCLAAPKANHAAEIDESVPDSLLEDVLTSMEEIVPDRRIGSGSSQGPSASPNLLVPSQPVSSQLIHRCVSSSRIIVDPSTESGGKKRSRDD